MTRLRQYLPVLAGAGLIVLLQVALSAGGAPYYMTQLTMSAYYALVVIGLCLLMGYAGQVSLGHAGFFAIGGYTAAVMTTCNLLAYRDAPLVAWGRWLGLLVERQNLYGARMLNFSPWAGLVAGLLASGVIALLIGMPILRLKGHYLAMATLGFGLIIYRIVLAAPVFGQADGISNVPPFPLLAGLEVNGRPAFRLENYYIAWALVAVAMVLVDQPGPFACGPGAADASTRARRRLTRWAWTPTATSWPPSSSAPCSRRPGACSSTHYNGSIGPSEVSVTKSVRYVAIVAAGGMANLWGALVMAVVLNFLSLRGVFGTYDDAVFGAILIAIMVFAPEGQFRLPRWAAVRRLRPGGPMAEALLETRGLNRFFGGLQAVKDVSLKVHRGQIKAVIGPNGAGKTTLFNLIAGTLAPQGGAVLFQGRPITAWKPHAIAALGIARTFQTTRLFSHMTVLENVMVGRHARTRCGFLAGHAPPAPQLAGGFPDRRPVPAPFWRSWACFRTPPRRPATSPSACSAWSSSRGPWPPSPPCCCWTSRPPASTSTRPRRWPPSSCGSASGASPAWSWSTTCPW